MCVCGNACEGLLGACLVDSARIVGKQCEDVEVLHAAVDLAAWRPSHTLQHRDLIGL